MTLFLSEAGPGRFGRQLSLTFLSHTIPCHTIPYQVGDSMSKYMASFEASHPGFPSAKQAGYVRPNCDANTEPEKKAPSVKTSHKIIL